MGNMRSRTGEGTGDGTSGASAGDGVSNRSRGLWRQFEEAKKLDLEGLSLLGELAAALGKKVELNHDVNELHRLAAEEVEPVLGLLHQIAQSSCDIAAAMHTDLASLGGLGEAVPQIAGEEAYTLLRLVDAVE